MYYLTSARHKSVFQVRTQWCLHLSSCSKVSAGVALFDEFSAPVFTQLAEELVKHFHRLSQRRLLVVLADVLLLLLLLEPVDLVRQLEDRRHSHGVERIHFRGVNGNTHSAVKSGKRKPEFVLLL